MMMMMMMIIIIIIVIMMFWLCSGTRILSNLSFMSFL